MRVVVTGTPGTGKTTVTERLETDLETIHLNEVIETEKLYDDVDEQRDSLVADLSAIEKRFEGVDDVLIESHLAHYLPADRVVVLRCHPAELVDRLRDREHEGSEAAALENAEAEALDLILTEAVERHGRDSVYEFDTTGRDPGAVVTDLQSVIRGDAQPAAGTVDFTGWL